MMMNLMVRNNLEILYVNAYLNAKEEGPVA